jgi:uncharacterized protein YwlG (UPF0340 family)
MALKTFNVDKKAYEEFSKHCKKHGISMSKKIENFIKRELESIKDVVAKTEEEVESVVGKRDSGGSGSEGHSFSRYC